MEIKMTFPCYVCESELTDSLNEHTGRYEIIPCKKCMAEAELRGYKRAKAEYERSLDENKR